MRRFDEIQNVKAEVRWHRPLGFGFFVSGRGLCVERERRLHLQQPCTEFASYGHQDEAAHEAPDGIGKSQ